MKAVKRIVSCILVISLLMSLVCVSAFAEGDGSAEEYICGKSAHTHGEGCWENVLVCQTLKDLTCPLEEHSHESCSLHVHKAGADGCYPLVCTEEHEHTEACYSAEPACGKTEADYDCGKTVHVHEETCFAEHIHTEACYEKKLTCTMEEHVHSAKCKPTLWYGDEITREVTAGTEGYTFLSVYPGRAYEMSNHMVSADGGASNDIPQTLILVDASRDYTWKPDGRYTMGSSNYEVLYCCDEHTGYVDNVYYKRMNLEDSTYYDEDAAAHIRSIITNSYPYISLEEMKENLLEGGFADAEKLTRAEIISGVQMAVWGYANGAGELAYSRTFDVTTNPQWGTVFHDFTNEMDVWWTVGKRKFSTSEEVAARVNGLSDYLKSLEADYAENSEILITNVKVLNTVPVQEQEGTYNVVMQVQLNNSGSHENDEITMKVYVDGIETKSEEIVMGTETYDMTVEAKNGQVIEVVAAGTQIIPEGVYFYEPAGGRDISQSLVGVAAGETDVYAKAEFTLDIPEPDPAKANLLLQKTDSIGRPLGGASFELYAAAEDGLYKAGAYAVDENGQLRIENLLPGSYELKETAAPEGYELLKDSVRFSVSEEGTVTLTNRVAGVRGKEETEGFALTVANRTTPPPYVPQEDEDPISVSAEKIWVGDTEKVRPETITVRLLKNGEAEDEKVLSAENNWSCTWDELDEDYTWTVEEAEIPEGYKAEVVQSGMKFTITNTYKEEPEKEPPLEDVEDPDVPKGGREEKDPLYDLDEDDVPRDNMELEDPDIPKTSDNTGLLLWMTIAVLSAAAMMGFQIAERKIR